MTPERAERAELYHAILSHVTGDRSLWRPHPKGEPGYVLDDRLGRWRLVGTHNYKTAQSGERWHDTVWPLERIRGSALLAEEVAPSHIIFLWDNAGPLFVIKPWPEDFDRFIYSISVLYSIAVAAR